MDDTNRIVIWMIAVPNFHRLLGYIKIGAVLDKILNYT